MKGTVDKLIGNDEIRRLMFFLQRSDSRYGKYPLHAQRLQRVDICAKVQLRGQQLVSAPMPCQKDNLPPLQVPQNKCIAWLSERRVDALLARVRKTGHGVQPAAPDNSNFCLLQSRTPSHHPSIQEEWLK